MIAEFAVILALAAAPGPKASAEQRAQTLQKLEDDINSDDPNIRLAALEYALENGSIAEKTKAYSSAFASSDVTLRAIAFTYKVCSAGRLSFQYTVPKGYGPNGFSMNEVFNFLHGGTDIILTSCDVQNASSDVSLPMTGNAYQKSWGSGRFNGTNFTFNFVNAEGRNTNVTCNGVISLAQSSRTVGTLSCTNGRASLGPLAISGVL